MNVFLRVAVTVAVMTMMVALVAGCGESKKERDARDARGAEEARVEARAQERKMAREATEREQEQAAERALAAEAERVAQIPYTGWYTDNPDATEFRISTAQQLVGLARLYVGDYSFAGKTVTLTADIDLSAYGKGADFNGGKGWVPIQDFWGTFNGNGKKISGLYINDTTLNDAGLFSSLKGRIENLGVEDVNITGGDRVGGVVGLVESIVVCGMGEEGIRDNCFRNDGTISDCYSTGTVKGKNHVGGIAGNVYMGSILRSYSAVAVSGNDDIGGIAGVIFGEVSNSYATGNVKGANNVGGVVGALRLEEDGVGGPPHSYYPGAAISVSNCYSTGAVNGTKSVGGVVGLIDVEHYGVSGNAALNPSVKSNAAAGRVVGEKSGGRAENNAAFANLKDRGNRTDRWVVKGPDTSDGEDITAAEIASDPTLGGRFKDGWTTSPGKLPGLGGKVADMPGHLR